MQNIPATIKIEGKTVDLKKEDLELAATFISPKLNRQVQLIPTDEFFDEKRRMHERVKGSGVTIKFKGGYFETKNKVLCRLIMECTPFKKGKIRIDPTDPTGFWRKVGVLETRQAPVTVQVEQTPHITPEKIDFSKAKLETLKDEEGKVLKDADGKPVKEEVERVIVTPVPH